MSCRNLDMEHYPRRAQFDYFRSLAYPYAGMTVNLDITEFLKRVHDNGRPFFLSLLYVFAHTSNAIPEFRRRIQGEGIVEYDFCNPSYTLAIEGGNYCYCSADARLPFPQYLENAKHRQEAAKQVPNLKDGADAIQHIFVSEIPWVSYTALIQPVPEPADSNPRITCGRYFQTDGRVQIPVTLLVNHALMDGYHISRFFLELQRRLNDADWLDTESGGDD